MMMNIYAAGETAASGTAAGSGWSSLIIMVAIFAVFYFVLIVPQKKQEKKQRQMIDALRPGDEVVTIGGVYGKIQTVKDDYVVLETTADKTKIKFAKSSISKCLTTHDDEPEK